MKEELASYGVEAPTDMTQQELQQLIASSRRNHCTRWTRCFVGMPQPDPGNGWEERLDKKMKENDV